MLDLAHGQPGLDEDDRDPQPHEAEDGREERRSRQCEDERRVTRGELLVPSEPLSRGTHPGQVAERGPSSADRPERRALRPVAEMRLEPGDAVHRTGRAPRGPASAQAMGAPTASAIGERRAYVDVAVE